MAISPFGQPLSVTKLEVLFILSFASMDGDSAEPESVLSQGQAIFAPSLSLHLAFWTAFIGDQTYY